MTSEYHAIEIINDLYKECCMGDYPITTILKLVCDVDFKEYSDYGNLTDDFKKEVTESVKSHVFNKVVKELKRGIELTVNGESKWVHIEFNNVGMGYFYSRTARHEQIKYWAVKKAVQEINNNQKYIDCIENVHVKFLLSTPLIF